jgi:two-component system cell cycle sensor histidine kinase/response regulator CckA
VLETRRIDLNLLLADIERMLTRMLPQNIDLRVEPTEEPAWVRADPGQLEQVIVNLAVNARDAMPEGGTLAMRLEHVGVSEGSALRPQELPEGAYVRLSVADTGVGMTPEVQARSFEPFFTTKEIGKGTGLGLSTVFGIVKKSGGFLRLDSEVGRGTTLEIYLPASGTSETADADQLPDDHDLAGSETILVAEHNPDVLALTARSLAARGYRVLTAASAEEAITVAQSHDGRVDLLIADLVMRGMGGHGLSKVLCRDRPELRVLYVSGYAELESTGERPSGLNAPVLYKPFTGLDLARCVRKVLRTGAQAP